MTCNLLERCRALGIQLEADRDRLAVDAPVGCLTPDVLDWLKRHKSELLVLLQATAAEAHVDLHEAEQAWHAAQDRLDSDSLFPPDVMDAPWPADVRWASPEARGGPFGSADDQNLALADRPSGDVVERFPLPAKSCNKAKPICRCGSTTWRDVPIHGGRSVRRDCGRCGRFLDFPVWYGKDTGHRDQYRV